MIGDVIGMIKAIPSLSDVAFGVEDLKNKISAQFLKTHSMINLMEQGLKSSISNLQNHMGNQLAFNQLISKYYVDMKDLNHALDMQRKREGEYFYVTSRKWAEGMLRDGNIGKWLKQYQAMMTGKERIFGGEPLIVQLIKKRYIVLKISCKECCMMYE